MEELLQRVQELEARQGAHGQNSGYEERTSFMREVELEALPRRFKVPSIPQYNGDSDPYDHLDAFKHTCRPLACCWEECQRRFLSKYRALRRQLSPSCHLATIFQRSSESLKDYIARFWREVSNVESPSDESILTAISAGLRKDGKLYESIYKSPVTDLGEFYERAAKEIRWEEAFGSKKPAGHREKARSSSQDRKRNDGGNGRDNRDERSSNQVAKRARREEREERPPRQGRFNNYAALSDSQERIFATEKRREDFGRPNPIKTPNKFRNWEKFCAYHNEVGHDTSECYALKDVIEELIRRGRLRDYVVRPANQPPQQTNQQRPPPEDEHAPAVRMIYTIHGGPHLTGTSNRSHERYVREANHVLIAGSVEQMGPSKRARVAMKEITFSEDDARDIHWPHNDALVICAYIGNMEVQRIMVDTGSSVNVMYRAYFDQMGLGPEQLSSSPEPLYGFTGDAVVPIGRVKLPFTVGSPGREATAMEEFLIIDCPSAYNVVLGRPVMNELDMVASTRALTIKFPTNNGTGCMLGEQHLARRCYEDAVKMGANRKKVNVVAGGAQRPSSQSGVNYDLDPREVDCDKASGPVEELEEVLASEVDAERCLKLGKNLAPEVKC
ncbi:uncharacterized protein LOC127804377 [Diospyros lotus]|uniref:uncharacterized protein LOC127804377 n=1 Tax=Diospyros lotus TaxID=55363 RepID=UPI002253F300|nr:uncharacterized protein LOC127804377 [Diospyros lotus]